MATGSGAAGGAAAAGGVVGGIIGNLASADSRRAARDMMSEALGELENVQIPDAEKLKIALEHLESQGVLTPELEHDILQDPSGFMNIKEDQGLKQTQMDYLNQLKDMGRTGLTSIERAELNKQKLENIRAAQAKDQDILANMAARGAQGMQGNELAQRLLNSQQSAERQQQDSDQIMSQAQARALNSIMGASNQAQSMSAEDYARQANAAKAQDAINQFNTNQRGNVQARNVGTQNTVQQKNLGEKQRIADTNVGLANEQEKYNKYIPQMIFQDQMQKANAVSAAKMANAKFNQGEADAESGMWSGIGSGIGQGAAAIFSDEKLKKDFKSATKSIEKFLDSLKGFQYHYKDEADGEGEQVGPIAQNIEKTDMGKQMVKETPHGKMVDYGKGFGAMAASLNELHERLKKLEEKKGK